MRMLNVPVGCVRGNGGRGVHHALQRKWNRRCGCRGLASCCEHPTPGFYHTIVSSRSDLNGSALTLELQVEGGMTSCQNPASLLVLSVHLVQYMDYMYHSTCMNGHHPCCCHAMPKVHAVFRHCPCSDAAGETEAAACPPLCACSCAADTDCPSERPVCNFSPSTADGFSAFNAKALSAGG